MNIVALCAANTEAVVVAFTLEDTHLHLFLYGTRDECVNFKKMFEATYCRYAARSRSNNGPFRLTVELYSTGNDEDYIRNIAAYTVIQPTKDGKGRVPAAEILVNTAAITEYIKDKDKLGMIETAIAEGHMQYHSQTFDQSLLELYNQEKITLDVALNAATNRDDFELKIRGVTGSSERGWM